MGTDLRGLVVEEVGVAGNRVQKPLYRMAQVPCSKVVPLTPCALFFNSKLPFGEGKGVSPLPYL